MFRQPLPAKRHDWSPKLKVKVVVVLVCPCLSLFRSFLSDLFS
jgi:hypothetical protein